MGQWGWGLKIIQQPAPQGQGGRQEGHSIGGKWLHCHWWGGEAVLCYEGGRCLHNRYICIEKEGHIFLFSPALFLFFFPLFLGGGGRGFPIFVLSFAVLFLPPVGVLFRFFTFWTMRLPAIRKTIKVYENKYK